MDLPELYTPEEINGILAWAQEALPTLPDELEIAPGMCTHNLKQVVTYYIDIVNLHRENPTYTGQIGHLFRIREVLTKSR